MKLSSKRSDGWYAYDLSPEGLAEKLPVLDAELSNAGRSRDDVTLYVGPNRHPINDESVAAYAELGVAQIIAPLGASSLEKLEVRTDALLASFDRA